MSLKPLEEAQRAVLESVSPLGSEVIPLQGSLGRILATEVVAAAAVPPFANSAMDGFAVRGEDVAVAGATLEVVEDLKAGAVATGVVGPAQAMRIMTGAPLPGGADTVVRVEETSYADGRVTIRGSVGTGTSVRMAGGDIAAGDRVFSQGTRIGPMHIGVLATLGVANPTVFAKPQVAYMSTGDELTPVDSGPLLPGMIRDSNRPMLAALLSEAVVDGIDIGSVPDDEAALRAALDRAAVHDVVVTTGGVSMGDYDVTKLLLEGGGEVAFWKVAIQPAKPFAFGRVGDALFFGLPGNPVSAFISFEQFLRPALMKMSGSRFVFRRRVGAIAGEDLDTDPEKTVFLRVFLEGEVEGLPRVVLSGGQSSNVLSATALADGLAVVPRGTGVVATGGRVMLELSRAPEAREEDDG